MAKTHRPTAADLAEIAKGKGSARDKREAAAYGSTKAALKSGKGGSTKRRKRKKPR